MTNDAARIRLAVIGTGAISQVVHVPILAEREDVDLVALADRDTPKADAIARRFNVEVADLKRWNDLRSNRITAGDYLVVYPKPGRGASTVTARATTDPAPCPTCSS